MRWVLDYLARLEMGSYGLRAIRVSSTFTMIVLRWLLAASSAALSAYAATSTSLRTFENTNVQRTIELSGSLTHVTTTFTIKALGALGPNVYTLALSEMDHARTSMLDVKLKGAKEDLKVSEFGYNPKRLEGY